MPVRITEELRGKALLRPLKPAVYRDTEVRGFMMVVTIAGAFGAKATS